jgi:DinB superfamily
MSGTEVLIDSFERIRDAVYPATNGLSRDELAWRPDDESNSIAWLVWHLSRIQDDRVAALTGGEQVWTSKGWAGRFSLALPIADTGLGHSPEEVGKVVADAETLLGYFEDVHGTTLSYVGPLTDDDLSRVVDRSWDPPETVVTRLVGVIADDLQHAGQAAYVRGILARC